MRPGGVFLNYRHEDTSGYAGRLYELLKSRFPGRVFLDFGEIQPGSDFVVAIENAVGQATVLIALIGKHWLGNPRLQNAADFVRLEIATALKRNIAVIPVLVGGAALPSAAELPEDMSGLPRRQAIMISDSDWDAGAQRLIRALEQHVGRARTGSRAKRWAAAAAVTAVALGVTIAMYLQHRPPPSTTQVAPDPQVKEAMKKNVEAEVKGLDAITTALDGVTQQIQNAGQPAPVPNGLVGISVLVKDKANGRPVPGARVLKLTGGIAAFLGATDDSGRLALNIPPGKMSLIVEKAGYQEPMVTIDPSTSKSVEIGLDLK